MYSVSVNDSSAMLTFFDARMSNPVTGEAWRAVAKIPAPFRLFPSGDLLALMSAGAYVFAMAGNYNTRPLAAEVLVHGSRFALVRRRQRLEEIWAEEKIPSWLR